MWLGCIGDDFTGSSDLANTLTRGGMRTVQYVGVPGGPASADVEAGVVALKSRTIPAAEAVAQALRALAWLRAQGCAQILFKVCSTFDSTDAGNIGPVTEALADALGADRVVVCPAFPGAGRRVFQGHLFVGDALLSESGMEFHPLTPMRDADLRRVLARQSRGGVGHVALGDVENGVEAIRAALDRERGMGRRLVIADAVRDGDLLALGAAAADLPLLTGGSGLALGLPANFRGKGLLRGAGGGWRGEPGPAAILAGSCSPTTRAQIVRHREAHPAREIDVDAVMAGNLAAGDLAAWLVAQDGLPLAYSSAEPAKVRAAQDRHGRDAVAAGLEAFFAATARALVGAGVTRLVTAGGETAGAVVEGLGLATLEIGPEIAPGVPALRAGPSLTLALKSGNFGGPGFFAEAAAVLGAQA